MKTVTLALFGRKKSIATLFVYTMLILCGVIFTLPFFWLISTSFKPAERIQVWPPDILPKLSVYVTRNQTDPAKNGAKALVTDRLGDDSVAVKPLENGVHLPSVMHSDDLHITTETRYGLAWYNYKRGLTFIPFFQLLKNTACICALAIIGTLLSCSLIAYGLSKIDWAGRNVLFIVMLGTMMLPSQVTMIPVFSIFVKLGWVNTILPLTVPTFLGNAFFVFLLRQFYLTIPKDLSEAAKLDGCSEFDVYRMVVLPLAKPALFTVGLFTFMNTWNDFMGPLIYLVDESKYTLSLGLAMFTGQYGNEYGMLMAVSTVVVLPIILLFFFTQRTFVQGITMSGIKG
ncbi:MAG: carbohydrate ABC transporter permease [Armatimonadota bacterium]